MLLTAALGAAGIATATAQVVYSVNIVGYINIPVPANNAFALIANQLNAQPDNKVTTLIPAPPNFTSVFKFDPATGAFLTGQYVGGWTLDDDNMSVGPGEGLFIQSPTAFTLTLVGEVKTGTSTTAIPTGFSIVSSVIPQTGKLQADLNYIPSNGDFVFQFDPSTGGFITSDFQGAWEGDCCSNPGDEPVLNVGEAFFLFHEGAAKTWTRTFNVNG